MKKKSLIVKKLNIESENIFNQTIELSINSINLIIGSEKKGQILFKSILDLIDSSKKCYLFNRNLTKSLRFTGYYSPSFDIEKDIKIKDFFKYSMSFYKNDYTSNLERLLDLFKIDKNNKIKDLEKETIELIKIIEVLYHKPYLLLLDEPYKYLNSDQSRILNQELIKLKENNSTILINSNIFYLNYSLYEKIFVYLEPKFEDINLLKEKTYSLDIDFVPQTEVKIKGLQKDNETYLYTGELKDLFNKLDINIKLSNIKEVVKW